MTPTRHENVLRMDGYFENGVQAFIVLEFAPGGDLSTLPRSEMSDTRISSVLKQLADGLIHCHREGIIHRDIKVLLVLKLQTLRLACYRRYQSSHQDDTVLITSHRTASSSWTHMLILYVGHTPLACIFMKQPTNSNFRFPFLANTRRTAQIAPECSRGRERKDKALRLRTECEN